MAKLAAKVRTINRQRLVTQQGTVQYTDDLITQFENYEQAGPLLALAAPAATADEQRIRSKIEDMLRNVSFDAELLSIAKGAQVNSSAANPQGWLDDINAWMQLNSKSVKGRNWTRGSYVQTTGTNTTDWVRCNVDSDGNPLESSFAEKRTYTVVRDQNNGAFPGREVWGIQGAPYEPGGEVERGLSARGSGMTPQKSTIAAVNADDSILQNSSFSDRAGTSDTTPTAINGWGGALSTLAGTGADAIVDRTNYYQASAGESSGAAALLIKSAATFPFNFFQNFVTPVGTTGTQYVARVAPVLTVPYDTSIAISASGAGTGNSVGTLKVIQGSYSTTYPITGKVPAGALAAGGSLTVGTYYLCFTCVKAGVEGPPSPISSAIVVTSGNQTISASAIAAGPSGSSDRIVYLGTSTTDASTYKKVSGLGDNTTTTLTITVNPTGVALSTIWPRLPDARGYVVCPAIPPGTSSLSSVQKNRWLTNFNQANAQWGYTLTYDSGSGFLVDRAIATALRQGDLTASGPAAISRYGNTADWLLPRSGSVVAVLNDAGTITDSEAAGAYLQEWLGRKYDRSLVSAVTGWTVPEPATP